MIHYFKVVLSTYSKLWGCVVSPTKSKQDLGSLSIMKYKRRSIFLLLFLLLLLHLRIFVKPIKVVASLHFVIITFFTANSSSESNFRENTGTLATGSAHRWRRQQRPPAARCDPRPQQQWLQRMRLADRGCYYVLSGQRQHPDPATGARPRL